MQFTLIVAHEVNAKRKVGFHFWCEYLVGLGHQVKFVSVGHSFLTKLQGKTPPINKNKWVSYSPNLQSYAWVPPVHPCLNKKYLSPFLMPIFRNIPNFFSNEDFKNLEHSDVFIVESGIGLSLIPKLKKICPNAIFIYSACDRLKTVGAHPYVLEAEKNALQFFDLIRVPATVMLSDFEANCPIEYIPQGMDKIDFDQPHQNPYTSSKNAVSVGDMLFDEKVISTLAENFSDWTFHLFGRNAKLSTPKSNVIAHGEVSIQAITAFIKHADIGIAPYKNAPNCEYLSQSSLKMIQYTYSKLPIVAPTFASNGRRNVLAYKSSDLLDEVISAFNNAIKFDRNLINIADVLTWDQVINKMLEKCQINISQKITTF